jgi:hypothetical protein
LRAAFTADTAVMRQSSRVPDGFVNRFIAGKLWVSEGGVKGPGGRRP